MENNENSIPEPSSSYLNDEENASDSCTSHTFPSYEYENSDNVNLRNFLSKTGGNSHLFCKRLGNNVTSESSLHQLDLASESDSFSAPSQSIPDNKLVSEPTKNVKNNLLKCGADVGKLSCETLCLSLDSLSEVGEHSRSQLNPSLFEDKFASNVSKRMDYLPKNKGKGKKLLNTCFKKTINEDNRNVIESSNKYSLFSLQLPNENMFNFQPNSNHRDISYNIKENKDNCNGGAYRLKPFEPKILKERKKEVCIVESSTTITRVTNNISDFNHGENSGDACIVSSSTGQLDPIDFYEHSDSSNSCSNPPILDSTVDSTSEQNFLVSPYSEDNGISQKSDANDMGFVSLDASKCNMGISLSSKGENHDLNSMPGANDDLIEDRCTINQQFIDILSLNNFNLSLQSSMHEKHAKKNSTIENLSTRYDFENPGFSNIRENSKKTVNKTNNFMEGPLITADGNILSHISNIAYKDNPFFDCKLDKSLSQIGNIKLGISKLEPESFNVEATRNIDNSIVSASCQELDVTGNNIKSGKSSAQLTERCLFSIGEHSTGSEKELCLDTLPDRKAKLSKKIRNQVEHLRGGDETFESCSKHTERTANFETTYDTDLNKQQLGTFTKNRSQPNLLAPLLLEEHINNATNLKVNQTIGNSPEIGNSSCKKHEERILRNIKPKNKKVSLSFQEVRKNKKNKRSLSGEIVKSNFECGGIERRFYACEHCDLSFDQGDLLELHLLEHSLDYEEQTSNCESDYFFDLHSTDTKCPSCLKDFNTLSNLVEHIKIHSSLAPRQCLRQQSYKCSLCYKTFRERNRLIKHAESHKSDSQKPFECSQCIRRFCNKSALGSHLKLHLQGKCAKTYNCPICGENFSAVVSFKAHLSVHSVNGEFTCPSCSKKFSSYHKIRRHIRSYHTSSHPCEECGKVLPSVEKLKIHLLSHSDRRDVACPKCPKHFKRKDKMKEHLKRMHRQDNHDNTNKTSTQNFIPKMDPSDYKQFMYKCYLCLLGFKRRGMLVNHLSKRHPGISIESVPELNQPIVRSSHSYMCQYCGKTYSSTAKRKLHILKNHPGAELPQRSTMRNEGTKTVKTFAVSCPWCPRQYATKAKLLQHQRHHHCSRSKNKEKESRLNLPSDKKISESQPKESLNNSQDILSRALDKISNKPLVYGLSSDNGVVEIKVQSGSADFQMYPKQNASTSSCSEQVYVSPFVVSREGTYTVLTPDGSETFTLSLRSGQILPSVDAISVLTPETGDGSSPRLVTLDSLQHAHFSQDDVNSNKQQDSCIVTQDLSETTPVLIWQP